MCRACRWGRNNAGPPRRKLDGAALSGDGWGQMALLDVCPMSRWLIPLILSLVPASAMAEDSVALGWGRLFSNDALGDFHDRWHTGSYAISQIRGTDWRGTLPNQPFQLMEYRFEADTIAPADLIAPAADDRRYAGVLSFGLHSQFDWQGFDTNIGADLVVTGPQTGISGFQSWVHNILGMDDPTVFGDQIGNGFYPTLSGEVGKVLPLGPGVSLRPFAAASAGVETFVRVGGDLTFGQFGQGAVMLRDTTTGQRYRGVAGDLTDGLSLMLGGDMAHVFDSALLPDGGAAVLTDTRTRVRLGMQWESQQTAVFYGLTWLSPEFDSQPEAQIVGSINVNLRF
jgi:Uncharacterized protein conserved in bacteria (DUF2219)